MNCERSSSLRISYVDSGISQDTLWTVLDPSVNRCSELVKCVTDHQESSYDPRVEEPEPEAL